MIVILNPLCGVFWGIDTFLVDLCLDAVARNNEKIIKYKTDIYVKFYGHLLNLSYYGIVRTELFQDEEIRSQSLKPKN